MIRIYRIHDQSSSLISMLVKAETKALVGMKKWWSNLVQAMRVRENNDKDHKLLRTIKIDQKALYHHQEKQNEKWFSRVTLSTSKTSAIIMNLTWGHWVLLNQDLHWDPRRSQQINEHSVLFWKTKIKQWSESKNSRFLFQIEIESIVLKSYLRYLPYRTSKLKS